MLEKWEEHGLMLRERVTKIPVAEDGLLKPANHRTIRSGAILIYKHSCRKFLSKIFLPRYTGKLYSYYVYVLLGSSKKSL
jgi:hypothetical protein